MSDVTDESSSTNHGVSLQALKIANVVAFIATLALNGISSVGSISDFKVGDISRKYPIKITPDSTAVGICWGIIYALDALFVIYGFFWPKEDEARLLHGVGFWFLSTCMCNSLWIIIYVQGPYISLLMSTVIIVGLLFSLCKIYVNTGCWLVRRPGGPLQKIALDVHFSIYASWVTLATIINISQCLSVVLGTGEPAVVDPLLAARATTVMLVIALLLNTFIVVTRRDCIWGYVLAWASYWIYVAREAEEDMQVYALPVSIIIGLITVGVGVHTAVVGGTNEEEKKVELI